jgi:stage II sporulation protein R
MKPWKISILVLFIALQLLSGTVLGQQHPNEAVVATKVIPEEAIRLRILANSDEQQDQVLKRRIRDQVIVMIKSWSEKPKTIEQARSVMRSKLPSIRSLVERELRHAKVAYSYKIKLGHTKFPTKTYGGRVYPAGVYEALLITLGAGEGKNWWCVLFPALCFIDLTSADPPTASSVEMTEIKNEDKDEKPRPRFWLWEWLNHIFS